LITSGAAKFVVSLAISAYNFQMDIWSRLFAVLAIALLATQPVMACCLVGHEAAAQETSQVASPPCHDSGMPMAPAENTDTEEGSNECPGCYDCDSALMQAQTSDDSTALTASSAEVSYAVLAAEYPGFAHAPVIFKTGPPGEPSLPLSTPITLKQRLLI